MSRPRCACGYLAASHVGLRWHWSQKWCAYGREPEHISYGDLGLEPPPMPPRPVMRDTWSMILGQVGYGPYLTLDNLLEEFCALIKEREKSPSLSLKAEIYRSKTPGGIE